MVSLNSKRQKDGLALGMPETCLNVFVYVLLINLDLNFL